MKTRFAIAALSLAVLTFGSFLATTSLTSAHERRTVGNVNFVVGFLTEPVIVNTPNSIDLRISRPDTTPITGAEQTLKAKVIVGSQSMEINLTPRFNTPGAYNAQFTPTSTEPYTFHFTGMIEGQAIDQKFTSSSSTFGTPAEPVAFPAELPVIQNVDARVASLESAGSDSSSDKADTAMIVGIAGVLLGAAGLGVAGLSLTRKAS